jgi:hypothetical protein
MCFKLCPDLMFSGLASAMYIGTVELENPIPIPTTILSRNTASAQQYKLQVHYCMNTLRSEYCVLLRNCENTASYKKEPKNTLRTE